MQTLRSIQFETPVGLASSTGVFKATLTVPSAVRGSVLVIDDPEEDGLERAIAQSLTEADIATLVTDGLTDAEHEGGRLVAQCRSDIECMATRLVAATDWLTGSTPLGDLPVGYLAADTGAAGALWAAAQRTADVAAIVAIDARPLYAAPALRAVRAPTLFIVRPNQLPLLKVSQAGFGQLLCEKRFEVLRRAAGQAGSRAELQHIVVLVHDWLDQYLRHS